jgi:hypothetical protein
MKEKSSRLEREGMDGKNFYLGLMGGFDIHSKHLDGNALYMRRNSEGLVDFSR